MNRKTSADFDQRVLDLYDEYVHGAITRRDLYQRVAAFLAIGASVEAVLSSLMPNYVWAQQVAEDDGRIKTSKFEYDSPMGGGKISGLLAHPVQTEKKFPSVLVIHENRGLNPYIRDVARRLAVEGF